MLVVSRFGRWRRKLPAPSPQHLARLFASKPTDTRNPAVDVVDAVKNRKPVAAVTRDSINYVNEKIFGKGLVGVELESDFSKVSSKVVSSLIVAALEINDLKTAGLVIKGADSHVISRLILENIQNKRIHSAMFLLQSLDSIVDQPPRVPQQHLGVASVSQTSVSEHAALQLLTELVNCLDWKNAVAVLLHCIKRGYAVPSEVTTAVMAGVVIDQSGFLLATQLVSCLAIHRRDDLCEKFSRSKVVSCI